MEGDYQQILKRHMHRLIAIHSPVAILDIIFS